MRIAAILLITLGLGAADLPLGHPSFTPSPEHPVGWRGDGSGCFPGATPVTSWDLASGQNIRWKAEVPYWGTSSPIVIGDRVITTCEPFTLLCYHADTGELLWHNATDHLDQSLGKQKAAAVRAKWVQAIAAGKDQEDKNLTKELLQYGLHQADKRCQGHTFPTPVSDGTRVYTSWGNNTATCYDLEDGAIRWQTFFGPLVSSGNGFDEKQDLAQVGGFGERWVPSPLLVDGVLITLQGGIMHGLDPASGKERWRWYLKDHLEHWKAHDQLVRRKGAQGHWGVGTPALLDLAGTKVLVTSWGHCIRAADGVTLSEYIGAMGDLSGTSPVADDERDSVVFSDYQDGGSGCATEETWAVRITMEGRDRVVGDLLWHHDQIGCEGGSMLCTGGVLFDNGLRAVDIETGARLADAPGGFKGGGYCSPSLAGTMLVHFRGNEGQMVALSGGRDGLSLQNAGGGALMPGDGKKGDPRKQEYQEMMLKRARAAVAAGILPYVDHVKTHGSWADCYGSSPFFQGDRMYVRTRLALYCIGPAR